MNRIILLGLLAASAALIAIAQSTNIPPDVDKGGRTITPRPQPHLVYSPADLAHNAVTLPASGTTIVSAVVNMSAVTKSTLFVNCTQPVDVLKASSVVRCGKPLCGARTGGAFVAKTVWESFWEEPGRGRPEPR
ncbi:MAG TPA: hypothetical protein VNX88_07650 [Terriglobales bacterium]|jgi:hypothetical protein|nr:hypothetical protein [Terriglobales bacterium]